MTAAKTNTTRHRVDPVGVMAQAIEVGRVQSFPELAALLLARRFQKLGRRTDARRVLLRYLGQHPHTVAILSALQAAG